MTMAAEEEPIRTITRELEVELWKHAGRWVIRTASELIAVGDSAEEVLEAADQQDWPRGSYIIEHLPEPGTIYVY